MRNLQEWLYGFALALILTTQPLQAQKLIKDSKELTELRAKAESGDASAQFNLGNSYRKGEGVTKDDVQGYMWFLLAGVQGTELAKKNIEIIKNMMTPEQIAEGQKLAREFKPRKP